MRDMFSSAESFNQDISDWDVSSVTDMVYMFAYAYEFNQDISSWDVSSVTNMYGMFYDADDLSDDNKCYIHTEFSSNDNRGYDWEEYSSSSSFQPETKDELQTAVDEWIDDPDSATVPSSVPSDFQRFAHLEELQDDFAVK